MSPTTRLARRFVASLFNVNDIILYGKYKNKKGRILEFGHDPKGNPTILIEPIPKGRKQNKLMGLFKIWKAPLDKQAMTLDEVRSLKDQLLSEMGYKKASTMEASKRVVARFIKAEGIPLGKTWETGTVRIHRYRGSFQITDLTNAGKRGKKVKQMSLGLSKLNDEDPWYDNMAKILAKVDSYDEVKRLIKDVQQDYPNEIRMYENELRGIDVNPGGTTKLTLSHKTDGGSIEITAEPNEFLVKSTHMFEGKGENKKPFAQDTLYYSKKKESAAIFYNWLKANLSEAGKMDITDLRKLWSDLGVKYDYH